MLAPYACFSVSLPCLIHYQVVASLLNWFVNLTDTLMASFKLLSQTHGVAVASNQ